MSKEIKLPSGATVVFKDPASLKQKDRQKVFVGVSEDIDAASAYEMQARIISVLVESWSFDLPLPSVDVASLGELEIPDYDVLAKASEDAMPALFPQLAKTIEVDADPKVITEDYSG